MAGFAINLDLILNTEFVCYVKLNYTVFLSASFHKGCVKVSPESCFLTQFNVERREAQPFGWNDDPKEILVWHTKTKNIGTNGGNYGYITEK
jgi:hypothetical protein